MSVRIETRRQFQIFPTIGIARLGNSPNEYFVGPEIPRIVPAPIGGFKDALGRIKRQAARFRIYELDALGVAVREITSKDAKITWRVHCANKKAAWHEFKGRFHNPTPLRNASISPADRDKLVIDPGEKTIQPNDERVALSGGAFFGKDVPLGELRLDAEGRLLVLGGCGHSAPSREGAPITNYANNDYWHDDASDGTVTATIEVDGVSYDVISAHVICAPPRFAPHLNHIVTLYDVMYEVAVEQEWEKRPERPSFYPYLYDFFMRAAGYRWVNAQALRGHGPAGNATFDTPEMIERLSDSSRSNANFRMGIFRRIRSRDEDPEQALADFMPQLSGDDGDTIPGQPRTWLAVTRLQHDMLRQWAEGDFESGRPPSVTSDWNDIAIEERPWAHTTAALEACVGGAFFPGIEMTYISEDKANYISRYRLHPDRFGPGDVTKYMACPWQADFYECSVHWWPVARPDDVITLEAYEQAIVNFDQGEPKEGAPAFEDLLVGREAWDRGLVDAPQYHGDLEMVHDWHRLGFIVPKPGRTATNEPAAPVLVEVDRGKYVGLDERAYFHILLNLDQYPDFLPKARELTRYYLDEAWRMQEAEDFQTPEYRYFEYDRQAFNDRLQRIYMELRRQADTYEPALDTDYPTREAVIEHIRQYAPFNQLDGAWLRNVTRTGPISDVHALLFSVWKDEMGDGTMGLNHSNLYTDLMRSVGIWLPHVTDEKYAQDTNFLDSAFTLPTFQLAISALSEEFFPELLGMTLRIEWEVLSLWPSVKRLRYHNIDPHFYTMHIGIDNAASGHGAQARRAVELFLDDQRAAGGDEAVQQMWRRIWNGYVAFAILGTLAADTAALVKKHANFQSRIEDMIARKQEFGQYNHGDKMLAGDYINDWFENPPQFARALVQSGYIVPGDPDNSPFFALTSFDGPMFKVFTDDELALWRDWILSLRVDETKPYDPLDKMLEAISVLSKRGITQIAHSTEFLYGAHEGVEVTQNVMWWLNRSPEEVLEALVDPKNALIVPFHVEESRFIHDLLSESNRMGQAWAGVAPGTNGASWRDVAIAWINQGAPTRRPAAQQEEPVPFVAPGVSPRRRWHRFNRYGMEAVH